MHHLVEAELAAEQRPVVDDHAAAFHKAADHVGQAPQRQAPQHHGTETRSWVEPSDEHGAAADENHIEDGLRRASRDPVADEPGVVADEDNRERAVR